MIAAVDSSYQRMLVPAGYDVHCSADPLVGIQAAAGGDFDVVLVCESSTAIDGLEMLRQIKDASPSARVVVISRRRRRGGRGGDEGGSRRLPPRTLLGGEVADGAAPFRATRCRGDVWPGSNDFDSDGAPQVRGDAGPMSRHARGVRADQAHRRHATAPCC